MNDRKIDLITIGDSTIDTFIKIHDASVECDINHEDCKICVTYGDKIPVDTIGSGVAGNAANVAVGCVKLGLTTAIYTNLGNDSAGTTIKKSLEERGVLLDYVQVHENKDSNLSVILTFQGERTAFVYHQPWFYKLPDLAPASWVYLTSVSESFTNSNIMDEVCHYIDRTKTKLVFSPGTFQLKADVKRYPAVLERCEVFIVNLEEAKKILNIDAHETVEVRDLLSKLLLLGPKRVVITDGDEGSYASDGQKNLKMGVYPVQVLEKTGAGDAYTSAIISALCLGKSLEEGMLWGTLNAAFTVQKLGPQNGLLTASEIENYKKSVPDLVARSF